MFAACDIVLQKLLLKRTDLRCLTARRLSAAVLQQLLRLQDQFHGPGRDRNIGILILQKDEGGIIHRPLYRVDPLSVCKIQQSLQAVKSPLTDQPIHILECRTEICAALPDDGKIPHVGFHLFLIRNETVLLHLFIALDDVNVRLLKITVRFTENIVSLLKEPAVSAPFLCASRGDAGRSGFI